MAGAWSNIHTAPIVRDVDVMSHSIVPPWYPQKSNSEPHPEVFERTTNAQRPVLPRDLHSQPNDSDLHAYLATELFDPPPDSGGAEQSTRSHSSASVWEQTPTPPESYQTEAHTLFRGHTAVERDDSGSSWDCFGVHNVGSTGLAQASSEPVPGQFSAENTRRKEKRKQGLGSKAQKRHAQLQEDNSRTIYDQLEQTATELRDLKVRHQQLEGKNLLLEKCLKLEHSQKLRQTSREDVHCDHQYIAQETDASEQGPCVTLSVRGEPHSMTVYEVSKIGVPEFASLWTATHGVAVLALHKLSRVATHSASVAHDLKQDYIQTIGACLVQVGHATDGPTVELLQQLTAESSQLHGCIKLLNHKVHKAMLQGQMDTQLARAHTIDKFYKTFVGLLQLTKEQFQDLEMLRRIYVVCRSSLAKERKMLVHQAVKSMSHAEETVPLPGDTRMASLAARLQEMAQEDYRVYHRVAAATRRGVLSTKQWANLIVHSYPYIPDIESALEAVAREAGQPPKQVILDDRMLGNMAAEWQELQGYLELVARQKSHAYVPLSVQSPLLSGASLGLSSAASKMPFA